MKVHTALHILNTLSTKVTILLLLCCHSSKCLSIRENRVDEILFQDVLEALERTVRFLAEDYVSLNLDGLFGIRLCQGTIVGSVKDCSSSKLQCPGELARRLQRIESMLNQTADRAMPYVQEQDLRYFHMFLPTIDGPWVAQYTDESLEDVAADPGFDSAYDEEKGDECFSKLFGTYTYKDKQTPKCTVTDECWEYMTRPNTASYAITHQLLFFVFIEKAGCLAEIQKHYGNATTLTDVQQRLCAMIYSEAKEEVESGSVAVLRQDIFLEQSALCGFLGFRDFVTPKWIHMVLGWQNARGCFALPHSLVALENKLNNVQQSQRVLLDLLYDEARQIDEHYPVWKGRQLLREQMMDGDCLAHKTGLGLSVLGVYTRQLLRQLYSK